MAPFELRDLVYAIGGLGTGSRKYTFDVISLQLTVDW